MLPLRRTLILVLNALVPLVLVSSAFAGGGSAGKTVELRPDLQIHYDRTRSDFQITYSGTTLELQKQVGKTWEPLSVAGIRHEKVFLYLSLPARRLRQAAGTHSLRFVGLDPSAKVSPRLERTLTPEELQYPQRYFPGTSLPDIG